MRKMILICDTGYCGTTSTEGYLVTDEQYLDYVNCAESCDMDNFADEQAHNNALQYGIEYSSGDPDEYDEYDEYDDTMYSDDIYGIWETYNPVTHGDESNYDWKVL